MNLSGDPWIPVIRTTKGYELVSLKKLFEEAAMFADLCVNPPQRVALMRLLLAIAQRSLNGPVDEDDWRQCRDRLTTAAVTYLDQHYGEFELYGPKAFLQGPGLAPTCNASLDKLDFCLSSGNNHTIFDHDAGPNGRNFSPAWQALMLLTFQCFSPGGLIGTTTWNDIGTNSKSEHSPALEGTPLHLFLQDDNLLDTIHLNLIPFNRLGKRAVGVPIWEQPPRGPDDGIANNGTFLGRLAVMPRAVRLEAGLRKFTLANGIKYPKLPEYIDPLLTVFLNKKNEYSYLRINPEKHPWRELQAILALADGEGGRSAIWGNLKTLARDRIVRLWTGGLAADQAKLENTGEWVLTIPVDMVFNSNAMKAYSDGVKAANTASDLLREGIKKYMTEIVKSSARDSQTGITGQAVSQAATWFWHQLDQHHDELSTQALQQDIASWRHLAAETARQAYEAICPHETPRQIEAYVIGRNYLHSTIHVKVINPQQEDKNNE